MIGMNTIRLNDKFSIQHANNSVFELADMEHGNVAAMWTKNTRIFYVMSSVPDDIKTLFKLYVLSCQLTK